jgi:hypothetical protein
MKLQAICEKLLQGRWKKILVGVVVSGLLLPIPAVALTFLGGWSGFLAVSGGAPFAQVSSNDTPNGGSLTVNMGSYSANQPADSVVSLSRTFRIRSEGEAVAIQQAFASIIRNANIQVTLDIRRLTGRTRFNIPPTNASAGNTIRTIRHSTTDRRFMTGGLYRISIYMRYSKTANGLWNNVTPHQFTFTGV